MLLEQLQEPADSQTISDKIMDNVRREVTIDGHVLNVTTSLNGAFYSGEEMSPEDLIVVADEALYKAKQAGRDQSYWARKPSRDPT